MESSKQVKKEAHGTTEDFQSEVLDLSTKQTQSLGPTLTPSRSLSLSSPPRSKRRRTVDPDPDCVSSLESSDFCTNRIQTSINTTLGSGASNTGVQCYLESISPCSSDDDDDARTGTVESSSVRAPDYPSLLTTMPPLQTLSPVTHSTLASRIREIPAFLAGHPSLNMAASAVAAAAVGINSSLNVFNVNCSVGSTLVDCSVSSGIPLRSAADCSAAARTPYASFYFQSSSRRRQKTPRSSGGQQRWDVAGSPLLPSGLVDHPMVAEDAHLLGGAAAAGNGGDRSQFEERDSAYLERRRKNNEAAKRSRDARRHKEEEIAYRAAKLEQENISLRAELLLLRRESAELHHLLYGRMDPQR